MLKKVIIFIMLMVMILSISCSKEKDSAKAKLGEVSKAVVSDKGIVKILPESTEFLAKFSSATEMFKYFSITESSIFGENIDNLDDVKKDIGFNPFNLSELKANGFSIDKEFGFTFDDFKIKKNGSISDDSYVDEEDVEFNGALFVPVNDGEKVISLIKKIVKENSKNQEVSFNKVGDFYEFKSEDFTSYIVEKDGYLILTGNPKDGTDTREYLTKLVSNQYGSLSESSTFSAVATKVGSGEEIFFYLNTSKVLEKNIDEIKKFADDMNGSYSAGMPNIKANYDYIKSFLGAGMSIDLENNDFTVKSVLNVEQGSELLKLAQNVKYNKGISLGIDEDPVLLTSFSVNPEEYFKLIINSLGNNETEQIDAAIEMVKSNYGIDIKKDIIEQLEGNLNLGLYDASSINFMNYNFLATLSIKDEAKFKETLDEIYLAGLVQLYIGVNDNNVIISVGKPMFKKALKADTSNGFVKDIDDEYLKSVLKSDTNVFYLNISETYKVFNTFSGMLGGFLGAEDPSSAEKTKKDIKDVTSKFEYILGSSYVNKAALHSDFVIKTNFKKPFMIGVKELVDEKKR